MLKHIVYCLPCLSEAPAVVDTLTQTQIQTEVALIAVATVKDSGTVHAVIYTNTYTILTFQQFFYLYRAC